MKGSKFLCIAAVHLVVLSGCGAKMRAPESAVHEAIGTQEQLAARNAETSSADARNADGMTSVDYKGETDVAQQSLIAWRKAIAGDEKGSLAMLADLDKRYPHVATAKFMHGQVLEHFGRKKEALAFYENAISENQFSSINLYKVAELKRTTGDAKGSIEVYRKLIKRDPDLPQAKLGLARALKDVDKHSAESDKLLAQVLDDAGKMKDSNPPAYKSLLQAIVRDFPESKEAKALLAKQGA